MVKTTLAFTNPHIKDMQVVHIQTDHLNCRCEQHVAGTSLPMIAACSHLLNLPELLILVAADYGTPHSRCQCGTTMWQESSIISASTV